MQERDFTERKNARKGAIPTSFQERLLHVCSKGVSPSCPSFPPSILPSFLLPSFTLALSFFLLLSSFDFVLGTVPMKLRTLHRPETPGGIYNVSSSPHRLQQNPYRSRFEGLWPDAHLGPLLGSRLRPLHDEKKGRLRGIPSSVPVLEQHPTNRRSLNRSYARKEE